MKSLLELTMRHLDFTRGDHMDFTRGDHMDFTRGDHMDFTRGDHMSGKPGNVREFGSCQGNVWDFTKS